MKNSENKKSSEELADETLDKVAGGQEAQITLFCDECMKGFRAEQMNWHDGHYYCPDCGKLLW